MTPVSTADITDSVAATSDAGKIVEPADSTFTFEVRYSNDIDCNGGNVLDANVPLTVPPACTTLNESPSTGTNPPDSAIVTLPPSVALPVTIN